MILQHTWNVKILLATVTCIKQRTIRCMNSNLHFSLCIWALGLHLVAFSFSSSTMGKICSKNFAGEIDGRFRPLSETNLGGWKNFKISCPELDPYGWIMKNRTWPIYQKAQNLTRSPNTTWTGHWGAVEANIFPEGLFGLSDSVNRWPCT